MGFPWHLPNGWEHSQSPRGCTAGQGNRSSPLAPGARAMLGGGQGHPSSQDALGCLFTGVGDFVESQVGAGKHPALHHQPDGGLGLCHPQRNSGGKKCNSWQGAGSIFSSLLGSSNTLLVKKKIIKK